MTPAKISVTSRRPGGLGGVNRVQILWNDKNWLKSDKSDKNCLKSDKSDKNRRENATKFWKIGQYPTKYLTLSTYSSKSWGRVQNPPLCDATVWRRSSGKVYQTSKNDAERIQLSLRIKYFSIRTSKFWLRLGFLKFYLVLLIMRLGLFLVRTLLHRVSLYHIYSWMWTKTRITLGRECLVCSYFLAILASMFYKIVLIKKRIKYSRWRQT